MTGCWLPGRVETADRRIAEGWLVGIDRRPDLKVGDRAAVEVERADGRKRTVETVVVLAKATRLADGGSHRMIDDLTIGAPRRALLVAGRMVGADMGPRRFVRKERD